MKRKFLFLFLQAVQSSSVDLFRIGEDSIYLESGDLTGVIESQFIYLNPLKTYSIFVDGTKYAIQTNDRIYYSSSFSPNPLPISPELTVLVNPSFDREQITGIKSSFVKIYSTNYDEINSITFTTGINETETFDIRPPDSRYPSSQERRDFGSYGFLANSKTILPYSFTILMSSAPEAMFLKYGQASEDLINTMEDLLNNYFTTNHIQRAVIYDVRIQNDKILFDCTLAIIMSDPLDETFNFISKIDLLNLGSLIELRIKEKLNTNIQVSFTKPVMINKLEKLVIPFAVMVTICGMIMIGSLVAFIILGRRNKVRTGEIVSNWFIGVFRPALLVMAETLLWRSYCEQRGLTYHFEPSYGISLLIMAVFGVIAAGIKVQSYVHRLRLPDEWHFPWSPGNIAVIMGILIHDLPFALVIYFYYIKYWSVVSAFQLTLMVFQAANLTLALKYVRIQRENNKLLRTQRKFWWGNFLTALFFFTVLVTVILMFSRTVALQVGKMALLNSAKKATKATMKYFTPNYKNPADIFNRNCMETYENMDGELRNRPSPINMSCLNSVEVGLLVMVCLCYLGFFLLVLYLIKYYRMLKSDKYATKQKLRSNSNTSADAIIPSNRDTSITLTKTNQTESFA